MLSFHASGDWMGMVGGGSGREVVGQAKGTRSGAPRCRSNVSSSPRDFPFCPEIAARLVLVDDKNLFLFRSTFSVGIQTNPVSELLGRGVIPFPSPSDFLFLDFHKNLRHIHSNHISLPFNPTFLACTRPCSAVLIFDASFLPFPTSPRLRPYLLAGYP
ncbi:hypothetical protein IE53DRAFT_113871 [Violaceomyces palustris]|uniref:Uncharacterized protein n=1 Tax=Violaceomyces palustris TaxID=1673888 RepID=A0ACD0NW85_9BASI|nr:hypothetical protein IE53DRAFT_113871 [Violaceomyces palustris]